MEDMRDNDQGPHRMKIERTTKELKKGKMALGMKASQGLFNRKFKKLDQSRLKKLMKMMLQNYLDLQDSQALKDKNI